MLLPPSKSKYRTEEGFSFVSIAVLVLFYVMIRSIERLAPAVPDFVKTEFSALLRWGPFLAPLVLGAVWFKTTKK